MKFKSLVSAAALLSLAVISSSAQAAIVQTLNDNGGGLATIDLDAADVSGNTAFGDIGNGNDNTFKFTSTENIAAGQGQTTIVAATGLLNDLTVTVVPPAIGFDPFVFNVQSNNAYTITVFSNLDTDGEVFTFNNPNNGNNFVRYTGTAPGEYLTSVVLTSALGVQAVQQFRTQDITYTGPTTPVPGPIAGAGLPALLAFGGFVWARRRKAAAVA